MASMSTESKTKYLESLYWNVEVTKITFTDLPFEVKKYLTNARKHFPNQDFEDVFNILYFDGTRDIAATISRPEVKEEYISEAGGTGIYVFNVDFRGNILGYAHTFLISSTDEDCVTNTYLDRPAPEGTETFKGYTRKGLAIKRLLLLNHFCITLADTCLRSSRLIQPEALGVWEKLFSLGIAEILSSPNDEDLVYGLKKMNR